MNEREFLFLIAAIILGCTLYVIFQEPEPVRAGVLYGYGYPNFLFWW